MEAKVKSQAELTRRLLRSYRLGEARIDLYDTGLETTMDGVSLWAEPEDNQEYRDFARTLGYGEDTLRMSREHEVAHTILSVLMGLPYSPTLYRAATAVPSDIVDRTEEAMVLAFQRCCRVRDVSILDLLTDLVK